MNPRSNSSTLRLRILAGATLAAFAVIANAQTVRPVGARTVTAVTGLAGFSSELVPAAGAGNVALNGIRWGEDSDRPCDVRALFRDIATLADGGSLRALRNPCADGNRKVVAFSGRNFIYAVQACTTDKRDTAKDRLKGLRVWARSVEPGMPAARVTDQPSPMEARHVNCAQWHARVQCPAGQVAIGLRAHSQGTERGTMSGFSLVCSAIGAGRG